MKDGINNFVVNNDKAAVNPDKMGTKASADYHLAIGGGETKTSTIEAKQHFPRIHDAKPGWEEMLFLATILTKQWTCTEKKQTSFMTQYLRLL